MRRAATLLCLLALLAGPAQAQQRAGRPPVKETPKEASKEASKDSSKEANAPADIPAPYDRDLMRMSEVIGALAFLRGLCAARTPRIGRPA